MKTSIVFLAAIAFAVPGFAQESVSRLKMTVGYGSLSLPGSLEAALGVGTRRHPGLAVQHTIRLDSVFSLENYFGYYSLGRGSVAGKAELVTDMLGFRIAPPKAARIVPFASAGLGGAFLGLPNLRIQSDGGMSTKIGGGIDIRINDRLAWKFDVSRMSFHLGDWHSGLNFMTGIAFKWTP